MRGTARCYLGTVCPHTSAVCTLSPRPEIQSQTGKLNIYVLFTGDFNTTLLFTREPQFILLIPAGQFYTMLLKLLVSHFNNRLLFTGKPKSIITYMTNASVAWVIGICPLTSWGKDFPCYGHLAFCNHQLTIIIYIN